jgi:hypothetical protein
MHSGVKSGTEIPGQKFRGERTQFPVNQGLFIAPGLFGKLFPDFQGATTGMNEREPADPIATAGLPETTPSVNRVLRDTQLKGSAKGVGEKSISLSCSLSPTPLALLRLNVRRWQLRNARNNLFHDEANVSVGKHHFRMVALTQG